MDHQSLCRLSSLRRSKCTTVVEPPNKAHIGTRSFVLYREVSFIQRLKCTGIRTSLFVLYREVFFIRSILYQRFYCSIIKKGPQCVLYREVFLSFIERCSLFGVSFIGGSTVV